MLRSVSLASLTILYPCLLSVSDASRRHERAAYSWIVQSDDAFMKELMLLIDGSVNGQLKIGYGAYLALSGSEPFSPELKTRVQVRRFEQTSSTKLELQTLLWALDEVKVLDCKVTVYTDSQNNIGLPGRRKRLEKNDYRSGKGRRLNNYLLYRGFYRLADQLDIQFVKVRGHQQSQHKDKIDQLFTLVDRASRQTLRADQSRCIQN